LGLECAGIGWLVWRGRASIGPVAPQTLAYRITGAAGGSAVRASGELRLDGASGEVAADLVLERPSPPFWDPLLALVATPDIGVLLAWASGALGLDEALPTHLRTSAPILDEGDRQLGAVDVLSTLDAAASALAVRLLAADLRFEPGELVTSVEGPWSTTLVPLERERVAVLACADFGTSRGHDLSALASALISGACSPPAVHVIFEAVDISRGTGTFSIRARGRVDR